MAERLRARAAERATRSVVGPAPAYIARRADRWRCNVVLRGDGSRRAPRRRRSGSPWSVDVDPESLL